MPLINNIQKYSIMKKFNFIYGVFALLFIAIGCGKDDETPETVNDLKTEITEVVITEKESKSIKITSGNGSYKVSSSDEKVATAVVEGNTVSVEAKKAGSAKVTLSDAKNKSVVINVTVDALISLEDIQQPITLKVREEKIISIASGTQSYTVKVDNDNVSSEIVEGNKVKIVAQKAGNSKVTITDAKTNKTVSIDVVVEHIDLAISTNELVISEKGTKTVTITSGSGQYEVNSSATDIATVALENGIVTVTAVKKGTATITVKDVQADKTQEISVKIVEKLRLRARAITTIEGKENTMQIFAGEPTIFTSKDSGIATARADRDEYGDYYVYVRGVKPGKTTIDVSDGDTVVTLDVTVEKIADLAFESGEATDTENLVVGGGDSTIAFKGSGDFEIMNTNEDIATAKIESDSDSMMQQIHYIYVTPKKVGTATITIKDKHSNKTITLTVTVE